MASLFEVVFENIVKSGVIQLLLFLISCAERVINIQCSENVELSTSGELDEKFLESVLNYDGDISVVINLGNVNFGSLVLPKVLLRLVKYDNQFDIDFNFDTNDLQNMGMTDLAKELHTHTKYIAKEYEVATFFGGIEPASDVDTRYFTNGNKGRLAQV